MIRSHASAAIPVLLTLIAATPATAQENYSIGGDHVAIYNLAGQVQVVGTSGNEVTVEVDRQGADAAQLDVEVGEIDGRQTLRVIYPADRIVYTGGNFGGNTSLRVREDGTWGGDGGGFWNRGDQVRVSSRGRGLDAHANLRIGVPRGQRLDVHLAAGRIAAENVDGEILLDTHSGEILAGDMVGSLTLDTGSGSVGVAGMRGDLLVDTGSGSVRVARVTGEEVSIDTGSGRVEAEDVRADELEIDTGSGSITLRRGSAPEIRLDTGSGSVTAELLSDVDDLEIDTGSGSVTLMLAEGVGAAVELDSGSGGLDVDFPISITHRARQELEGEIGDGNGRIVVDTGSGRIRLRRL